MLKSAALLVALSLVSTLSFANDYPIMPDPNLTPGVLCVTPNSQRYPEKINYCDRNVTTETKAQVFVQYDQLGFRTQTMNRVLFKIDHYIPLCAGGSNDIRNLWPQHVTVYTITDLLEATICEKMAAGRLLQKDAIRIIIQGKHNLNQVPAIITQLKSL
ncbi:MAG: hypothetical protein ACXVCY_00540 [Pseudobdellovibrionaceae bacterium]